jgi:hypothetical protein
MRGLGTVIKAAVAAATLFGPAAPAVAGTSNAFTINPVNAVSDRVTYSKPKPEAGKGSELTTYVGFIVGDPSTGILLTNASGNTINDLTLVLSIRATNPAETFVFHEPDLYLPAGCTWSTNAENEKTVTCKVRQVKAGETVYGFTAFVVAPQKACEVASSCADGKISTSISLVYAEGQRGPNAVWENSTQELKQDNLVSLGTDNPVNIKSAVPKSGATVFTGNSAVPTPLSQFGQLLKVPALPANAPFTVAEIAVTFVSADASDGAACLNGGRFKACPTFTTTIGAKDPTTGAFVETKFAPETPVQMTYRIDASTLKMPAAKLLNSVMLTYFGSSGAEENVGICPVTGQPRTDGVPCLLKPGFCYKKNETGGDPNLEGDCEWTTISTGNGLLKFQ